MDNSKPYSVASSAGKVSISTAISRVLGLVREQVQAYYFGAGMATDAFVAAFRIPNLLRDLFAEGALSTAFIPVFKEKMVKKGMHEAFRLANYTMSDLIAIVGMVIAVGIIFSPAIVYITANGFVADPEKYELTVNLTRLMFIFLLLISVSAVQMGMLNSAGHFGVPALAPTWFNVGMIICPVFLYQYFSMPIYTLAIGVIIGGIGQIVFQWPSLRSIGYRFRFKTEFKDEGIRKINRLLSPMILGLSASRINIVVSTLMASLLMEGSMSYLNYAYRLMHFPLGVFGVALGTVTLPKVSEHVARQQYDQLIKTFNDAIGLSMFLIIPSAVYLAGFGQDVVRLIYERGAFHSLATTRTAQALFFYSFGLVGFAGVRVAAPIYYALGDARRPMYYSVISVIVNIILNFALIPLWDFAGLAAATSVAGLVNFFLLLYSMKKMVAGMDYKYLYILNGKIIFGSLLSFFLAYIIRFDHIITMSNIWAKVAVVIMQITTMAVLYLVILKIMKVSEVNRLLTFLKIRR
ncbi:Protein MurJ homolog [Candidatus Zixiibacteriota bacterium]|nr:Protein MurJ homolog [candidate division Zixibacteria bacterium]